MFLKHNMRMNHYQEDAARTISLVQSAENRLVNFCFGLTGESGELIDHVKKHLFHGHPIDRAYAKKELGDILWYVAALCTELNLSLGEVAEMNIDKLKARYPNGFSEQDSIDRVREI